MPSVLAGGKDTLSLLGKSGLGVGRVCWITYGFIVSTSPRTGAVGSANVLKCAFCLCTPGSCGELPEPRRACALSHDVCRKGSTAAGQRGAWAPTRVDTITVASPRPARPRGLCGKHPFWAAVRTVRPRGRHEFSFPPFPKSCTLIISACFRML